MSKTPRHFDPAKGQAYQGDIVIMALPAKFPAISRAREIAPRDGRLILAEGEATGHHHAIDLMARATMFRDDALARDLEAAPAEPKAATARMYEDRAALGELMRRGILTTDRLCVGFLVVEGAPAVVRHQEHDPIAIPPGSYYVGRQQEFDAQLQARQVMD